MLLEVGILLGDDGLAQGGSDVFVADDDAALGGKLRDQLPVLRQQPGNGVRLVVVQPADLRQVVAVREEHAAQTAEQRRQKEERRENRATGDANNDAPGPRAGVWRCFGLGMRVHFRKYAGLPRSKSRPGSEIADSKKHTLTI